MLSARRRCNLAPPVTGLRMSAPASRGALVHSSHANRTSQSSPSTQPSSPCLAVGSPQPARIPHPAAPCRSTCYHYIKNSPDFAWRAEMRGDEDQQNQVRRGRCRSCTEHRREHVIAPPALRNAAPRSGISVAVKAPALASGAHWLCPPYPPTPPPPCSSCTTAPGRPLRTTSSASWPPAETRR